MAGYQGTGALGLRLVELLQQQELAPSTGHETPPTARRELNSTPETGTERILQLNSLAQHWAQDWARDPFLRHSGAHAAGARELDRRVQLRGAAVVKGAGRGRAQRAESSFWR